MPASSSVLNTGTTVAVRTSCVSRWFHRLPVPYLTVVDTALASFSGDRILKNRRQFSLSLSAGVLVAGCSVAALGQSANPALENRLAKMEAATNAAQSAGDNAWMLVSAALV